MMDDEADLAEKAGQLAAFAWRRRIAPADDPTYAGLIREYLSDARFARMTERFLGGLGLRVLGVGMLSGIVLGATLDSPFRLGREDYRKGMSVGDRIVQGLIHLAVAAWCFPRAEDLGEADDVMPSRLTVEELVEYIYGLCEELKSRHEQQGHTASSPPEVRQAWEYVLAIGKYADSAEGRRSFATLAGKVEFAFRFLADHGLLKREGTEVRGAWLAPPAFRIQVRELAGNEAWEIVHRAAQGVSNHG